MTNINPTDMEIIESIRSVKRGDRALDNSLINTIKERQHKYYLTAIEASKDSFLLKIRGYAIFTDQIVMFLEGNSGADERFDKYKVLIYKQVRSHLVGFIKISSEKEVNLVKIQQIIKDLYFVCGKLLKVIDYARDKPLHFHRSQAVH